MENQLFRRIEEIFTGNDKKARKMLGQLPVVLVGSQEYEPDYWYFLCWLREVRN